MRTPQLRLDRCILTSTLFRFIMLDVVQLDAEDFALPLFCGGNDFKWCEGKKRTAGVSFCEDWHWFSQQCTVIFNGHHSSSHGAMSSFLGIMTLRMSQKLMKTIYLQILKMEFRIFHGSVPGFFCDNFDMAKHRFCLQDNSFYYLLSIMGGAYCSQFNKNI